MYKILKDFIKLGKYTPNESDINSDIGFDYYGTFIYGNRDYTVETVFGNHRLTCVEYIKLDRTVSLGFFIPILGGLFTILVDYNSNIIKNIWR